MYTIHLIIGIYNPTIDHYIELKSYLKIPFE